MKDVSIVIPTFNRANLLVRAIESCLNQTYPCEVIVCDHGSSDNTPDVASQYKNKIRYIRRPEDKGPIVCWRDGIEQSNGEIIHINYDDDWIEPDFIEKTVKLLNDDVGFVYTNVMIHVDEKDESKKAFRHPEGLGNSKDILRYLLEIPATISPGCAIFRREDVLKNLLSEIPGANGFYGKNSGVGEDLLLFMLTALEYPKYGYIGEPLAHFFAHPGSITLNATATKKREQLIESYSNARRYFIEQSNWSTNGWDDISYFLRWNYKSGTLSKQISKKIEKFTVNPVKKIVRGFRKK